MAALANIRMLTCYAAWANSLLYASIAELPPIELTRERKIVFGDLLRTLNHVYTLDLVWQAYLQGRSHGFTTRIPDVERSLAELTAAQTSLDAWYIGYAEALSDSSGAEVVDFTFIAGMLYQIPATPPTTDLPVFLRQAMAK